MAYTISLSHLRHAFFDVHAWLSIMWHNGFADKLEQFTKNIFWHVACNFLYVLLLALLHLPYLGLQNFAAHRLSRTRSVEIQTKF